MPETGPFADFKFAMFSIVQHRANRNPGVVIGRMLAERLEGGAHRRCYLVSIAPGNPHTMFEEELAELIGWEGESTVALAMRQASERLKEKGGKTK